MVEPGTDDDVVQAIAIDIARTGHRFTELIERILAIQDHIRIEVGFVDGSADATEEDVCAAGSRAIGCVADGADDDIVLEVAVNVPGRRDRDPEEISQALTIQDDVRRRGAQRARHTSKNDESSARNDAVTVVADGADDHVVITIAVEVSCRRH